MSLFRPGENVERVAEGVRARVIIDGEAYFQAVAQPPPPWPRSSSSSRPGRLTPTR
ncbi:MAG: hypothetical protein IPI35_16300 [Deltaproteobacteria bacterium]|nr:hypothetical protein [Deltaproteobacteria bacterium]